MRPILALALGLALGVPAWAQGVSSSAAVSDTATSDAWRIRKIRLVGVATLDTTVLKGTLKFGEGETLTSELLADRQRESLRALLGTSLVSDAQLEFKEVNGTEIDAIVTIREVPLCGVVAFEGPDDISEKDVKEVVRVGDGSLLSQANLGKDRQAILKLYHDKGYLLAEVESSLGKADSTGKVPLTWKIVEKSKVRVGKIQFVGNKRVSRKKLIGAMVTKEKRWWRSGEFNQDTLQLDLTKIRDLYREKGYLDAGVDSHQVTYRPDGKRLDIRLNLHEGRRYYRGRVSFTGQDVLSERFLKAQATMDSGDVLNQKKLDLEEQNLQNAYREEGRLFVKIDPVKTYRDSVVDILYMIKEGPPASVGQVIVEGNTKTRDKVVRRELRLFPGDLFRQSLLMRSYREVMQLNFFDNVIPDIRPSGEEGVVDVVFRVQEKEKGTGTFSAGGAYSQNDGFVLTLGLQIPNVMGTGRRVDANIDYGGYKQSLRLGLTEPWFMDSPTRVGISGFYTHQTDQYDESYDYVSQGFDLSLGRRLKWPDDYFSIGTGYGFSLNRYQGTNSDSYGLLRTDGIESSVSVTLTRDDKDLPLFPTSGSMFQLSYRRVGGIFGGDFDYHQGTTVAKWWFPTVGKFVLGLELQGGIQGGEAMQYSALYREGGLLGYQGKMRGYDAATLGLYRVGRSFLSSTAELRYPVADQLFYLIAFMDAGNVFGEAMRKDIDYSVKTLPNPWEEIDLGNLKRDWGFGFRLNIPMMGILGFDFAWGLDDGENSYGQSIPNKGMHANFTIEQPF
ncbi:MAG: outer membrane protein assembly factor BamA [Fibrobacteres bacterium]|nr:outer membrane protein assembly factor BamA [Fibrobacterota bacterium]